MKHIAIFRGLLFDMVINGTKTIESRWSNKKVAPFNKVQVGDTIFIKKTSCDVVAKTQVKAVKFYNLSHEIAENIKKNYGKEIGIDYFENWENYKNKKYCTLIWLADIIPVKNMKVQNSHGAGWIVVKENNINFN